MDDYSTVSSRQVGWCYSHARTPCAYVTDINKPEEAMMIPFDNWWDALRFAVTFAHYNGAEYVGGAGQ